MTPSLHAHRRSHSLLLLQKLLNLRDGGSPLSLVLDSLEQTAGPLVREFITRAKIGRTKVVFVSFATLKKPRDVDGFIKARGKSLKALRSEVGTHCPPPTAPAAVAGKGGVQGQRVLVIIDSLNALAAVEPRLLAVFLSSIVTPVSSVVGVYHTDVPFVHSKTLSEYEPDPYTVLCHLATSLFRVSSLYQTVEIRRAQNRSIQEPEWGLREGREGVLIGLRVPDHGVDPNGIVLEMEMRRRSGRAVVEKFVLVPPAQPTLAVSATTTSMTPPKLSSIVLLSDHPSFAPPTGPGESEPDDAHESEEMETTFNLGLTEKQRRDREGIVLPYFDAQTDIGAGEGGRILYEMGREDDFDDEEDEI